MRPGRPRPPLPAPRDTAGLNAGGSVRFRHWRLYGERGLAGEPAAVWVWGETVTMEYGAETLAQYRVAFEADGRRLREVEAAHGCSRPLPLAATLPRRAGRAGVAGRAARAAPRQPTTPTDDSGQLPLFDDAQVATR